MDALRHEINRLKKRQNALEIIVKSGQKKVK